MRAPLATACVALLGALALWWGTDGGRALTAETARRLDIAARPRPLPDIQLFDRTGARLRLSDYRGAPLVMEFIYTTCPDICIALGTAFERLDRKLPPGARLVSVSFDPDDDPARLDAFAERHGATAPRWRVAGVADAGERAALIARAGVVVIPDGYGGFVHNAGLYLVDADGRLVAVFDLEDTDRVAAAVARHVR